MNDTTIKDALANGFKIDRYTITKKIGGGGFSIVYLAVDGDSGVEVVIKEFMPRKLAYRAADGSVQIREDANGDAFSHGRRLFFQEANFLANLKHHNIVNVINFFRANGTVYMVMDYQRGVTLQEYIARRDGGLSEDLIQTVFRPLLDGLKEIHERGLLHLDLKPGNIYLRPGADPVLLDFGAVHEMKQTRQYQPGQVLTPGFSPYEQAQRGGYVGPWSDIYSMGATMRACISGSAPPPADERRMEDKMKPAAKEYRRKYSQALLQAIDWAMEVDPTLRPQSVDQLLEAMDKDVAEDAPSFTESVLDKLNTKIQMPWGSKD
ncbi:MAG: serine/threonine protein kinase [Gammaproteobacteria bacterium]|nr:serine/threonine protein kinase [Gammaproteobacteria bacterium]